MDLHDLVSGWKQFKRLEYPRHRTYLEEIATNGVKNPLAVITCVDPRISLSWITSQPAGVLTPFQALGGIIPPIGEHSLTQEAYLEYALEQFKIDHLAVVGHLDCALVKALLQPKEKLSTMPAVSKWADLADDTREAVARMLSRLSGTELVDAAVQVHTLLQVEHLMTYPVVEQAVRRGKLQIHPLIYDIAGADLFEYSNSAGRFELLGHNGGADGEVVASLPNCMGCHHTAHKHG